MAATTGAPVLSASSVRAARAPESSARASARAAAPLAHPTGKLAARWGVAGVGAGRVCRAGSRVHIVGAVRAVGREEAGGELDEATASVAPFDPLGMLLDEELESDEIPGAMLSVFVGCLAGLLVAGPASAAESWDGLHPLPVSADINQLSVEGPGPPDENFWANVLSYIRFFFSIVTGLVYVILKPFLELLKKPQTAVFVLAGGAAFVYFIKFTIDSMLGLNDMSDPYYSEFVK